MLPIIGKVKKRKRDASGNPIGEKKSNPIFYSRIYELEFPDVHIEEFAVNVLAENIFNKADSDGWDMGLIDEVIGYPKRSFNHRCEKGWKFYHCFRSEEICR